MPAGGLVGIGSKSDHMYSVILSVQYDIRYNDT